jgi:hypothetical protein
MTTSPPSEQSDRDGPRAITAEMVVPIRKLSDTLTPPQNRDEVILSLPL